MTLRGPIRTESLQVGEHTYFAYDFSLLTWFPGERIVIGKYCSIAAGVVICTGGMRRTDTAALSVGAGSGAALGASPGRLSRWMVVGPASGPRT